jgi:hypothetical protein
MRIARPPWPQTFDSVWEFSAFADVGDGLVFTILGLKNKCREDHEHKASRVGRLCNPLGMFAEWPQLEFRGICCPRKHIGAIATLSINSSGLKKRRVGECATEYFGASIGEASPAKQVVQARHSIYRQTVDVLRTVPHYNVEHWRCRGRCGRHGDQQRGGNLSPSPSITASRTMKARSGDCWRSGGPHVGDC